MACFMCLGIICNNCRKFDDDPRLQELKKLQKCPKCKELYQKASHICPNYGEASITPGFAKHPS